MKALEHFNGCLCQYEYYKNDFLTITVTVKDLKHLNVCMYQDKYCSKYNLICDNIRPTLIGNNIIHANKCAKHFTQLLFWYDNNLYIIH